MAESTLTPNVAPRDPAALAQITVYQQRVLAEKVGALGTEAQKMAWHSMTAAERVAELARLLVLWDQQNPGAYQNGSAPQQAQQTPQAPPPQAPPQAPPQQHFAPQQQQMQPPPGMSAPMGIPGAIPMGAVPMNGAGVAQYAPPPLPQGVPGFQQGVPGVPPQQTFAVPGMTNGVVPGAPPQVNPGVAQTVQQAATATTGKKSKRDPVTTTGQAPVQQQLPNTAPAPQGGSDLGLEVLNLLQSLNTKIDGHTKLIAAAAPTQQVAELQAQVKTLTDRLASIEQNLTRYGIWNVLLGASQKSAQDGSSLVQALSDTLGMEGMFNQLLNQAISGKA